MAVRVIVMVLGLLSFAIIARHLGTERYGVYALVVAAIPLLATLVDLGLGTTAVREVARSPADAERIVSTALTIALVLGVTGAVLAAAALPVLPYPSGVREALAIAVPGLVVLVLGSVPGMVFQSAVRLEFQALIDLVGGVATFGAIVLVVTLGGGVQAIVAAWLGAIVLSTAVGFVVAHRLLPFRPSLDRPLARRLLRSALPIGLTFAASAVHFRVDTILLSLMRPIEDVGIYGVAFRFLEHGLFAPLFLMGALFPVLAGYLARDDPRLAPTVRKAFTLLLLLAVPAAVGVLVLAEALIELLVGGGYDDAATPLRILAVAVILAFVNPLFTNVLVAADLQSRVFGATLLAIVVNVGLNLVLIPRYSYNGAAAATVASEAVSVGFVAVWAMRRAGARPDWGAALRVVVAAAAMGAILVAFSGMFVLVAVAAGVVVYGSLVVALRVLTRSDLRALRSAG